MGAWHVDRSHHLSKLLPFREVSADTLTPGLGGLGADGEGQGGSASPHYLFRTRSWPHPVLWPCPEEPRAANCLKQSLWWPASYERWSKIVFPPWDNNSGKWWVAQKELSHAHIPFEIKPVLSGTPMVHKRKLAVRIYGQILQTLLKKIIARYYMHRTLKRKSIFIKVWNLKEGDADNNFLKVWFINEVLMNNSTNGASYSKAWRQIFTAAGTRINLSE